MGKQGLRRSKRNPNSVQAGELAPEADTAGRARLTAAAQSQLSCSKLRAVTHGGPNPTAVLQHHSWIQPGPITPGQCGWGKYPWGDHRHLQGIPTEGQHKQRVQGGPDMPRVYPLPSPASRRLKGSLACWLTPVGIWDGACYLPSLPFLPASSFVPYSIKQTFQGWNPVLPRHSALHPCSCLSACSLLAVRPSHQNV